VTPLAGVRAKLADLAAEQDGLLTAAQIGAHGLSDRQRRRLVTAGALRSAAPGVYAVAGCPVSHRYRLRLGLLSLGGASAVAFESAAALHGLDRSDHTAVEFLVPRGHRGGRGHFKVHTSDHIGRIDIVTTDTLRCTSATRTILDLALAKKRPTRIEAAIDSAVQLKLSSPIVLARRLKDLRGSGRWGVRTIDRLLEDSGGHTPLERKFLALVRQAGLPPPRTQAAFQHNGRFIARVDFLFEEQGVVGEVSGGRGHSTAADRAKDAQRRNELQDLGLNVYEFTWEQITQRSCWVREQLCAALQFA